MPCRGTGTVQCGAVPLRDEANKSVSSIVQKKFKIPNKYSYDKDSSRVSFANLPTARTLIPLFFSRKLFVPVKDDFRTYRDITIPFREVERDFAYYPPTVNSSHLKLWVPIPTTYTIIRRIRTNILET